MPRVTVILNEQEYAHVKSKAGLIPLSSWFRALALSSIELKPNGGDALRSPVQHAALPSETTTSASVQRSSGGSASGEKHARKSDPEKVLGVKRGAPPKYCRHGLLGHCNE
jgi:hypothetical protein